MRPFRKRPSGFRASPMLGDSRRMQLTLSPSTRETDSDPLSEFQKEISTLGYSSRANSAPACMSSSGEPAGTENWVASCVPAIASGTNSCSQTTPAFRTSGAAANQNRRVERDAEQLMASFLLCVNLGGSDQRIDSR